MITIDASAPVTTLLIARPERRNALDHTGIRQLAAAIAAAAADTPCRVLVIKGAGDTFCSGRDLEEADASLSLGDLLAYDEAWSGVLHGLRASSKPSLAVVRGHAVAGGFTLAMGCDFVIAEASARFGALEMRGGFPAAVNIAILTELVGRRQALDYLLSDATFPAEHLLQAGLINRVAATAAELEQIERELTARLARLDPVAVKLTMETARIAATLPVAEAIVVGRNLNALLMSSGRITEARQRHARRPRGAT